MPTISDQYVFTLNQVYDANTLSYVPMTQPGAVSLSSTGQISDGVDTAIKATVKDYTNSNPIATVLVDANGDAYVAGGSSGLTDTQLRATPVPISGTVTASGPLTDTQLRATPVPISGTVTASGPLTDTQLRATPVPVSGTVSTGGLTDTQLRATPVPISGTVTASGPLTDTQLRASAVPVTATLAAETTKVIGTVNQGTSPWVGNITQVGSAAVTLGQKTSANAIPVVRSSDELPPPDRVASGDITTVTTLQSMTTSGSGTTRLTIIGTWTGTLTFVGFDGTTSYVTKAVNISTGALESSTTANGSWWVPTAGATVFIVVGPTSTGTASITMAASPASSTVSLAQSIPTGTNSIGQVTANAGTNLNTSALATQATLALLLAAEPSTLALDGQTVAFGADVFARRLAEQNYVQALLTTTAALIASESQTSQRAGFELR